MNYGICGVEGLVSDMHVCSAIACKELPDSQVSNLSKYLYSMAVSNIEVMPMPQFLGMTIWPVESAQSDSF